MLNIIVRFRLFDLATHIVQSQKRTPNLHENQSYTLDITVRYGHKDLVTFLLTNGAPVSSFSISLTAKCGYEDIIKALINANPEKISPDDSQYQVALQRAVQNGRDETVSYLLGKVQTGGGSIKIETKTLHLATKTGQKNVLESLCAASTIPMESPQFNNEILPIAAAGGFNNIVEYLLDRHTNPNRKNAAGKTALHLAVEFGHPSTCEILFQYGADIHRKTSDQLSPIHIASKEGDLTILKWLITRSKDFVNQEPGPPSPQPEPDWHPAFLETPPINKLSPIELAASNGHILIVRELLRYPRFNGAQDCAKALPLAAKGGFVEVVEVLLQCSIDSTVRDADGNTALHRAAQNQYPSILKRLLQPVPGSQNKFDIESKNSSRWTALHLRQNQAGFLQSKYFSNMGRNQILSQVLPTQKVVVTIDGRERRRFISHAPVATSTL